LAVTIAFSDPVSGEIVEADVVINSKHQFAALAEDTEQAKESNLQTQSQTVAGRCVTNSDGARCDRKYDIQNVMTHEAGHFFGLAEDVEETGATMYECISACETHKRKLNSDDAAALTELYAEGFAPEGQAEAAGCSGAHVAPSTRSGMAGLAACTLALLGLVCVRRRRSHPA
jgi:hypothetical protein